MKGQPTDPRKVERYWQLRKKGWTMAAGARESGFSYNTARRLEDGLSLDNSADRPFLHPARQQPYPIALDKLKPEAKAALEDFGLFQRRYFGAIPSPWQVESANFIVEKLATPDKEFIVINGPPSVGKSTLNTLWIPAWLICRNRAIRIGILSASQSLANRYVQRLKRFLERTTPVHGDPEKVAKGLEADAVAALADDYGMFRPNMREVWSREDIVVAQLDGTAIDEKESTVAGFGFDSEYIGLRLDYLVADDVVTKKTTRNIENAEKMKGDWDDVAERRLDPGGVLLLQGQRLSSFDLYSYCKKKNTVDEDGDITGTMYDSKVFKAHYEDRCEGNHKPSAPPYPEGCLLEPRRLTWTEISSAKHNNSNLYHVVYQQEDTDPQDVLVREVWVYGGTDPDTGETFPGCLDRTRNTCELPRNLAGTLFSYATVDPSAARWWSVQWWVCRVEDGQPHERYLMDLHRARMMGPQLLDWQDATRSFVGVMEDWQVRAKALGWPIKYWVIERNGCQRWLMQYEHTRRWQAHHQVQIIPHETNVNKLDPDKGIESLQGIYKFGLVRLPFKGNSTGLMQTGGGRGYLASMKLIDEVTHLPDHPTSDCAMAQWFGEFHLKRLVPRRSELPLLSRPSWLQGTNVRDWLRSVRESA